MLTVIRDFEFTPITWQGNLSGMNYNFDASFEVYDGARWIFFDDADLGGGTLELDDGFLFKAVFAARRSAG